MEYISQQNKNWCPSEPPHSEQVKGIEMITKIINSFCSTGLLGISNFVMLKSTYNYARHNLSFPSRKYILLFILHNGPLIQFNTRLPIYISNKNQNANPVLLAKIANSQKYTKLFWTKFFKSHRFLLFVMEKNSSVL